VLIAESCGHVHSLDSLDDVGVSAQLVSIVRRRLQITDDAANALKRHLNAVVDALGDELRAALTGSTVTDRMRASILATRLENVLDLLGRAGMTEAEAAFFARYPELANLADDGLAAAGVPNASRILDEPAARLAIDATVADHLESWENVIERPMASRILSGMRSAVIGETLTDVVERIVQEENRRVSSAVTEARTRMAEFDRAAQEEAVLQAERAGAELVRVYLGPLDGVTRPFCRPLVGKALTRDQIAGLSNGQTAVSPLFAGGGYNCRHSWVAMGPDEARRAGIERASSADVAEANQGGAR